MGYWLSFSRHGRATAAVATGRGSARPAWRGKLLANARHATKDRALLKLIDRYVGWQVLDRKSVV